HKHLLEQNRIIGEVVGHGNHGPDYIQLRDKSRRQNLMRTVAPKIKTVEQPVQFLNRQDNGFIRIVRGRFESFGFEALEPKAEAVALPIKYFHPITGAIQKNKKHGIEHCHFDIQFNQGGEAVDGFSEVDRPGVEVDFFNFGVGAHHNCGLLMGIGSTASGFNGQF
ncbi:hypothetical protein, partial [Pseudomonas sp. RA_15y_Pfl1_P12]|uniref:hypothetical protein n=1 Tax=Pseudomonas sp. RA_15y_Pfl1_P12 TaxID=3088703 RepID=UPI00403F5864